MVVVGEAEILRLGLDGLRAMLSTGWSLNARERQRRPGGEEVDAVFGLVAPDGTRATILVETKGLVSTSNVLGVLAQLRRAAAKGELFGRPDAVGATMAGRAEEPVGDPAVVAAAAALLADDVLVALERA